MFKEGKHWVPVEISNLAVMELEKRIATLEARNAALTSEVKRLRRVGDEMSEALDNGDPNPLIDDWYEAKEGGAR